MTYSLFYQQVQKELITDEALKRKNSRQDFSSRGRRTRFLTVYRGHLRKELDDMGYGR